MYSIYKSWHITDACRFEIILIIFSNKRFISITNSERNILLIFKTAPCQSNFVRHNLWSHFLIRLGGQQISHHNYITYEKKCLVSFILLLGIAKLKQKLNMYLYLYTELFSFWDKCSLNATIMHWAWGRCLTGFELSNSNCCTAPCHE